MRFRIYILVSFFAIVSILLISCVTKEDPFKASIVKERMQKAFEWQQQNPKWALYDWTNGAYHIGISQAWKATNNQKYFDILVATGESNNWGPGERWYHADDLAICLTYTDVFEKSKDSTLLTAMLKNLDTLMANPVWMLDPKREFEHHAIVQLWWWCDALFMGPTVFTRYARISGEEKYFDFSDKLYHQAYDLLYNQEEHMFTRDLKYLWTGSESDKKEKNGKRIFWSRGNGWVISGLTFLLDDISRDNEKRPFYEKLFKEMAVSIKNLQPEDGLWRTSLLDASDIHGEMSGTSFFIYAMAWGVNNGYLDREEFLPTIKKSWVAMLSCQKENGMVGWVQQIGQSPKPVSSDSWEVYGTGAFLMAGSEVLKLNVKY